MILFSEQIQAKFKENIKINRLLFRYLFNSLLFHYNTKKIYDRHPLDYSIPDNHPSNIYIYPNL